MKLKKFDLRFYKTMMINVQDHMKWTNFNQWSTFIMTKLHKSSIKNKHLFSLSAT